MYGAPGVIGLGEMLGTSVLPQVPQVIHMLCTGLYTASQIRAAMHDLSTITRWERVFTGCGQRVAVGCPAAVGDNLRSEVVHSLGVGAQGGRSVDNLLSTGVHETGGEGRADLREQQGSRPRRRVLPADPGQTDLTGIRVARMFFMLES